MGRRLNVLVNIFALNFVILKIRGHCGRRATWSKSGVGIAMSCDVRDSIQLIGFLAIRDNRSNFDMKM